MLHFRVVCPLGQGTALGTSLLESPAVHDLVVWPSMAQRPSGDFVQFDVAREAANDVIAMLREQHIERHGSIAIERIDTALSDVAARRTRGSGRPVRSSHLGRGRSPHS